MKSSSKTFLNYLLFSITALAFTGLQTSLWSNYLGNFPAPHIWIPTLVYWCLYRSPKETIIMTYIVSLIISPMTALPLGLFIFTNIIIAIFILIFKIKFYQTGPIYFALNVGAATFLFVPVFLLTIFLLDNNNFSSNILFFEWIMKTLLTTLFSLPLHALFTFFDSYTNKELPTETGRGIA